MCLSPFLSLKLEVGANRPVWTNHMHVWCMHAWVIIICDAMIQYAHSLAHSMPSVSPLLSLETYTLDLQNLWCYDPTLYKCTLTTSLWIVGLPVRSCSCIKLPVPHSHPHIASTRTVCTKNKISGSVIHQLYTHACMLCPTCPSNSIAFSLSCLSVHFQS